MKAIKILGWISGLVYGAVLFCVLTKQPHAGSVLILGFIAFPLLLIIGASLYGRLAKVKKRVLELLEQDKNFLFKFTGLDEDKMTEKDMKFEIRHQLDILRYAYSNLKLEESDNRSLMESIEFWEKLLKEKFH